MKQLKVRFIEPQDQAKFIDLVNSTPNNLYDQDILKYPTLQIVCSYNGNGPIAYLPFQRAMFLESLAVQPGTPPIEAAQAFRDLVKAAELTASSHGVKELYFICKDADVVEVARHHGFEVLPSEWQVVRMKL